MSFFDSLPELLLRVPVVLMALMIHEVAHGYMAYRLGDPTARNLGRLTLNPLKHLDPIGALCMVFLKFGWAKPVPINSRYFKDPKRDFILTAAAGPAANLLLAFVGVILYCLTEMIYGFLPPATGFMHSFQDVWLAFLYLIILMNVSLGIFNLIPVPPFDGSRIFLSFLPPKYYFGVMKYERYIMIGFMFLLWSDRLNAPLSWIMQKTIDGMFFIVGLIPGL